MQLEFDPEKIKNLFREVGLSNRNNECYAARSHKHLQVFAYIDQIKAAFSKLSTKRPLVMIDCGCGRSYLSFILYEYCKSVLNKKIIIYGIDSNSDLISNCDKTAKALGFENMRFYNSDVGSCKIMEDIDIVYSLHACDTATDQTIAKGIEVGAKYIFSVSCCQHTNRNKITNHPLKCVSRHQPYKERLVDMLGDTMRGLLLEHLGYGVKIFEFVAAEQTPKNIMLRAIKNTVKIRDREEALANYKQLTTMFNFSPALEEYCAKILVS